MSLHTRFASPIAVQSTFDRAASTPLKDRAALSTKLAATYIGKAEGALKNSCSLGITDPPFVQDGRSITYRVSDLDDYLERHLVRGDR